jgi:hypothetical protein
MAWIIIPSHPDLMVHPNLPRACRWTSAVFRLRLHSHQLNIAPVAPLSLRPRIVLLVVLLAADARQTGRVHIFHSFKRSRRFALARAGQGTGLGPVTVAM